MLSRFPVCRVGSEDDALYADWWEGAEAYGLFPDGADMPAAIIEVCPEKWSNRMRVTEMWVDAPYRRRGYGSALMDLAKRLVVERGYRCLMVETQSCNAPAISFTLHRALSLSDLTAAATSSVARFELSLAGSRVDTKEHLLAGPLA